MSERWPGGIVRATPVTPTGPLQNGTAPGVWTLDQANYWIKQGLWPTAGNFLAVEDVFSTYLYTGNGSTQTITNGINLSGQGGMVWVKNRNSTQLNWTFNSAIGATQPLSTNSTDSAATNIANYFGAANLCVFNNNGFSFASQAQLTTSPNTYASWTFRKAANFFDVVTYTGDGTTNRNISHNLGIAPGCVIVKRTSGTGDWFVWHQNGTQQNSFCAKLNTTGAYADTGTALWGFPTTGFPSMTATTFSVGGSNNANENGATYVAYLFAHDTSSTGLIQCGSFTTDAGGKATVNLGWEPQWVLYKTTGTTGNWWLYDTMRGMSVSTGNAYLNPNLSNAEGTDTIQRYIEPTATGINFGPGNSIGTSIPFIYIAIRRGPMRTPTLGTSVFSPVSATPTGSDPYITAMTTNFPVDLTIDMNRQNGGTSWVGDRLRGGTKFLATTSSGAEDTYTTTTWPGFTSFDSNTSITQRVWAGGFGPIIGWNFRRAPSFFDVVCYTGTGAATTQAHNLGVAPELMIIKSRSGTSAWQAYFNYTSTDYSRLSVDSTSAAGLISYATGGSNLSAAPTTSLINLTANYPNSSGVSYVAYLFASCPGVSKVGSYTGTGALQTINCSFTTGARFVLIKRTDSTGDWYVWDSARGITSGNDPYQLLNSTDAEVTGTNYVDTDTTGFQVTAAAPAGINASGGTYIFLAVA